MSLRIIVFFYKNALSEQNSFTLVTLYVMNNKYDLLFKTHTHTKKKECLIK